MILMKTKLLFYITLTTLVMLNAVALANNPEKLQGMWIIDRSATEESVIAKRPFNDAKSFIMGIRYLSNRSFLFEGDKLYLGSFPGAEKQIEFQLAPDDKAEIRYISGSIETGIDARTKEKVYSKPGTCTINMLNDQKISIEMEADPFLKFLLWKHIDVDPNKTKPQDYKRELDEFITMILNISKAFESNP